ncbi:response regulator [Desulforamulus aquiferis]|uniref:Stage 0 sporulation protein A homolog n=1 Tax=Desulforamulus aquiferis TaxID=1397668 RepID=A0AAW7ZBT8_9FIRM|nr:response regulator [Desulforamulus aquiferis]MDO7786806.1 response regulator [Desulforamulus aquiferis]
MGRDTIDILIVDDQVGVRRLLFEALSDEGYKVEMAASGAEALNTLARSIPSLIFLDMKMPGMTGIETLHEIRAQYGQLTVVMMTAYGDGEIVNQSRVLGVEHYLNKPFDLNDVRHLAKLLVSNNKESA